MSTTQCLRCHRAAHVCLDCVADERDRLRAEVETLKRERDEHAAAKNTALDRVAELRERLMMTEAAAAKQSERQATLVGQAEGKAEEQRQAADAGWARVDVVTTERDRYRKALQEIQALAKTLT